MVVIPLLAFLLEMVTLFVSHCNGLPRKCVFYAL